MQEALTIRSEEKLIEWLDFKNIFKGLKWILVAIWKSVRCLFEVFFIQSPDQKYLEEQRTKSLRMLAPL